MKIRNYHFREFDAILIDFKSTIEKGEMFEFTVFIKDLLNEQIIIWQRFTWSKDKDGRDWIAVLRR